MIMIRIIDDLSFVNDVCDKTLVLVYDNWNDYGYYTTYNVLYYDENWGNEEIGKLKIYSHKLDYEHDHTEYIDSKSRSYLKETSIENLPEDFCSLGQTVEYYQNLLFYLKDDCRDVLHRLRDIAIYDDIYEQFINCSGVKKSLLRSANAATALSEAKKIVYGEAKNIDDDGVEDYATIGVQINQNEEDIYPYSSIKIERNQYSIYELMRKYEKGRICLEPSFQRHFVWSLKQQSELVESVIMGIPLPLVYLAENKDGQLVVVDGQQRLTTFINFFNNRFRLSGLKVLVNLNGKNYKDIDREYPNYISTIEDYQLVIQVVKYPTPDRIKFDIFDRVNRGGTALNKQEMRNALYQGEATKLLNRLSECEEFKVATGGAVSGRHMKDCYLVLRAIAFSLVFQKKLIDKNGHVIEYKSDMDDLMAKTMEYLNNCSDDERVLIEKTFKQIMNRSFSTLGQDAFRVRNESGRRRPISMTLFETLYYMFYIVMEKNVNDYEILHIREQLFQDNEFMDAVQYSVDSSKNVYTRFRKVKQYVEELI